MAECRAERIAKLLVESVTGQRLERGRVPMDKLQFWHLFADDRHDALIRIRAFNGARTSENSRRVSLISKPLNRNALTC